MTLSASLRDLGSTEDQAGRMIQNTACCYEEAINNLQTEVKQRLIFRNLVGWSTKDWIVLASLK